MNSRLFPPRFPKVHQNWSLIIRLEEKQTKDKKGEWRISWENSKMQGKAALLTNHKLNQIKSKKEN
jgi:hypothetical protein